MLCSMRTGSVAAIMSVLMVLIGFTAPVAALMPFGSMTTPTVVTCPSGFMNGATCKTYTVTCPGTVAITGTYGVRTPTSPLAGTTILHGGGGGTGVFDNGYSAKYFGAKYRVIQMKWASDWENTGVATKSIKVAACRPATVIRRLFQTEHGNVTNIAFCGHSHSGGSGVMGYLQHHYNMGNYFDAVLYSAGPVFGRIDQGCQVPATAQIRVCPNGQWGCGQQPGYLGGPQYGSGTSCGTSGGMGLWTGAPCYCTSGGTTTPAQNQAWWDMSVVSTGANFNSPLTAISQWVCIPPPDNNAAEQGQYVAAQYNSVNTPVFLQALVAGCSGAETIWTGTYQGQTGLVASANWMINNCLTRHD